MRGGGVGAGMRLRGWGVSPSPFRVAVRPHTIFPTAANRFWSSSGSHPPASLPLKCIVGVEVGWVGPRTGDPIPEEGGDHEAIAWSVH